MAYIQMSTLAASIISITYGLAVVPEHDPNMERADKALIESKETAFIMLARIGCRAGAAVQERCEVW